MFSDEPSNIPSSNSNVPAAGRTERPHRAHGDGTLVPGVVIPGESSQNQELPESGERLELVICGKRPCVIAHPLPAEFAPAEGAITDFLNCTFRFQTTDQNLKAFFKDLARVAGPEFQNVQSRGKGMNGYEKSFDIGKHGAKFCCVGQRNTALLMLPGKACHTIPDWPALIELLRDQYKARITRWDGAMDDFDGLHSVDWAVTQYLSGGFTNGGNKPSCRQLGNWIEPDGSGRTFYIGKVQNGKMLRVYEKGMQLGFPFHPWVRWEIELHNVDREIPWDVLLQPGKYLAGSYPKVLGWVNTEMSRVKTIAKEGELSYDHLVHYAATAYGSLMNAMLRVEGSPEAVLHRLKRDGLPRRLRLPVVPKGVK